MKKSLYFACFCIFAFFTSVLAVSLCSRNEVVTVVLDPTINGSGFGYNNEVGLWKTNFPYGTITGISTCQSIGGSKQGDYTTNITANGGENTGVSCWCKITHPMNSRWVFYGSMGGGCSSECAHHCGFYAQSSGTLRAGLFGSVQQ